MAKIKQHLKSEKMTTFLKVDDDVVITNGQYHDHFRPAFPLALAAIAKANFDRAITVPIDMDAWDDYLLPYSDIDIIKQHLSATHANRVTKNAVWLTTGTMGSGSCSSLRVKK